MSRRASGEGSFNKQPDGTWRARLGYTCPNTGVYRRAAFYGPSRAVVAQKLEAFRVNGFQQEKERFQRSMTVSEWCDHWLTVSIPSGASVRESTLLSYQAIVRRYVDEDPIGQVPLARLTARDIEHWLLRLRGINHHRHGNVVPLAPATIHRIYRVLAQALRRAHQQDLVRVNPAAQVRAPSREAPEASFLTRDELEAVMRTAGSTASYAAVVVLGTTGLRRGELLAMRWEDVDLESATLRVQWTLTRTSRGLLPGPPKTKGSIRAVPLAPVAVRALRSHRANQLREFLQGVRAESPYVFAEADGTFMSPHRLVADVSRASKMAGISTKVTPHTLRHTVATLLLENGVNARVVADWLGHSSPRITLEVYAHATRSAFDDARDVISRAIGQ